MTSTLYNKYYSYFFILILGVIVYGIYGQTFHFDYGLDDELIIQNLPSIDNGVKGLKTIITSRYNLSEYRPVTMTSFYLEKLVFGHSTAQISHTINVAIYFILICSTLLLVKQIVPKEHTNHKFLIIGIVALFCLHPIHANVVSNIKSRDNLLSALFLFWSLIFLFKMMKSGFKFHLVILMVLLFFLAFYSKRDVIGFLLLGPLAVIMFKKQSQFFNTPVFKYSIWFIAGLLFLLYVSSLLINKYVPIVDSDSINRSFVRFTENPIVENFTFPNRLRAFFSTQFLYLKMLVYPKDYFFYFGYKVFSFPFKGLLGWLSFLTVSSFIALAIYNFNKNKLLSFGVFFMGINLLYCSNLFVAVAGIVADRYAFIASLGFCIVLVCFLNIIKNNTIKYVLLCSILIVYGYFSYTRSSDWKNLGSLIEADIDQLNNSHEAQRIAANYYWGEADSTIVQQSKQTNLEKALFHITRANEIYPNNYITHIHEGVIRFKLNDIDGSIVSFQKSIDLDTSKLKDGYELLGDAYYLKQNYGASITNYTLSFDANKKNQYLLNKISSVIYETGNKNRVLNYNDSLINASPELYAPYENLAYFYLMENDSITANIYVKKAIERGINEIQIQDMIKSYRETLKSIFYN